MMNRGAARQTIFHSATDGRRFLALLGEANALYGIEVHAFCLMPNHYHLLLHCPEGGLSESMHRVGGQYAKFSNWRRGRDGPLVRGRFRSIEVGNPEYQAMVGRYIHRNPIELPHVTNWELYRWSSFRYYITRAAPPGWLHTAALFSPFGDRDAYRTFVRGDTGRCIDAVAVSWAINTTVNELAKELLDDSAQLCRAVAIAMLGSASAAVRTALDEHLQFPNPAARRAALYRSRRRLEADPSLAELAARATRLLA